MYTLSTPKQQELDELVAAAKVELQSFVQHIRWDVGQDWSGDQAIFFRIVLWEGVARGRHVFRITQQVRAHLLQKLNPEELGLIAYFSFRSESEQAALREASWM